MDGRIERPKTISELQQYCEEHGMPLLRMRFFIGEDYRQPKAFGIYQEGDTFVVYKNKDTGERAIRYIGTDEAYAVGEIFDKLLSECHKRGIYPDGESAYLDAPVSRGYPQRSGDRSQKLLIGGIIGFFAVVILAAGIGSHRMHRHDGYYKDDKGTYYYRYGSDWSYYDSTSNCWTSTLSFPYEDYTDYSVEGDYDLSWGISSIETSSLWDDWHTSSSYDSGSSYDSWDSGGTDWSSDW
ncbi:MAG: hypothetical protein J5795_04955 [Lachnospiraceae bacterium]|nr:hypothetical protein [Lachnospiraceae bacterium]